MLRRLIHHIPNVILILCFIPGVLISLGLALLILWSGGAFGFQYITKFWATDEAKAFVQNYPKAEPWIDSIRSYEINSRTEKANHWIISMRVAFGAQSVRSIEIGYEVDSTGAEIPNSFSIVSERARLVINDSNFSDLQTRSDSAYFERWIRQARFVKDSLHVRGIIDNDIQPDQFLLGPDLILRSGSKEVKFCSDAILSHVIQMDHGWMLIRNQSCIGS